ncbi:MAG: hypothetical protein FJX65_05615 [Alphaproteobacteria bacterium]|nr:hypothetical protein [Alphaproteobacteria bacterium]
MFGISATKIGIALLLLIAAFYVLRILRRMQKAREELPPPEEVRPCKVCGSYVAQTLSQPCGRGDCPFLAKKA